MGLPFLEDLPPELQDDNSHMLPATKIVYMKRMLMPVKL